MPRFRAPAKDEALLLRERGLDPAKVLIDLDSGHLYDADRVAPPSLGEKVTSGLRSVTGGLLQTAPALTSLVGAGVESLTGYKGVSDAADAMEQGIQKSAGADPRVSNWISVPGQTIGQIGSAMLGVGGASKLLSLGKAGSAILGPAIGTAMTAGDTVSEELDRQARDEEQRSAGKALIKGLGVGAASYPLERFGLGRIFDEAENIAAKPLMNRLLSLGSKGAIGEAAEEGIQYGTVEGSNTDPAKLAERMAAGALGGGVGGALVGGAQTPPSKPVVEKGVDKAKEMAAGKKTPTYNGPSDVTLDAMEASIRKGHKYDPVGLKTPVDVVFEELRAAQVPMLRDDIRRLFDIWGGSPANVPKVKQAAREMHDSWVANRPVKAMKTPEAVKKERADLDALDSEIKTVNGRYEKLQAAAQKDAEKANEAPAGTRWEILNNENAQLRTAEMQQLEEQLNQLVQQKKLLFSQMADPTDSSRRPVAEGDTMRKPMSAEEAAAAELRRVQGLPSVGGGELPGALGGLEGVPIETGEVQIPSGAPVVGPEQAALLDQQRLEQEAASAPAREADKFLRGETLPGMEGEQGVPFDVQPSAVSDNKASVAPVAPVKKYYSGVPMDVVGKNLKILGGKLGQYFQDHPHNGPLALLYDRTRSVRSRLAGAGPLGAYVAARMDPMWKRLTQIENSKLTQADQFRELVSHDSVIDWLFDSLDNQTEDYSKLPEKYRTEARQLMEFSKSFITDMQERGQFVRTGNTEPRLPEVIEGYLPTAVDQKVWEEIGTPEGYDKWEKIWVDNWARYRPQDSESQARELFRDFTSPISSVHAVGGEPLFMAARRAHGVPLPREMRDRDIMRGIQQYIGNFSADAVWTEFMQKDPLMRRAFGIKLDHQFVDHSAEDLDVEPVEEQWAQIIREGERVNAPWVNELTPGMPLGSPMLVRSEHGVAEAFLASLTETPTHRMTAAMKQFNNIGQIASSLLMQTATGIRDVAMGVSELAAYVPSTKLISQFADVVMDYVKYRDQARADGALKNDVYRHQAANIVSKAAYDTSRALRTVTARNFLDEFPRVFIHHAVKETVMQDFRTAGRSPLAEEFGALEGTPEERAESTSAAVVNRIAPNYDARSLPKDWIPQTRSLIGYLTQLSTWGVARYNTWYEDHYLPAMKSKNPNRLFRSLLFGTIGGAAANALIDELFKKKPSKLTWQEWMGLSSEKQIEEAAPLLFGIIQTQGLLGTAGDLALPMAQLGNRLATGKGPSVNVPDLGDATIPALLVAQDFLMTSADFISYANSKKWNIDWKDIVDLGNEYAKSAQTWRDMQGWFATNEKDVDREKNLYERMSGTSATTGEKIQSPLFAQPQTRLGSKFNLSKAFNSRTGADLTSLVPGLAAAAEEGYVPNLKNRDLRTDFWRDVVSRRGFDTAKGMATKLEEQQKEEPRRRQIRAALRSLAD